MKVTIITIWPDLDAEDPTRVWFNHLSDEPLELILLEKEVTKYGNRKETWRVTITDHDALILRLKFPAIEFL